jgi:uncharacterized protein
MMYVVVLYETVEGFLERRVPFRAAHRAWVEQWHREGRLVLGGAFDPPEGALLVFRVKDAAEVEEFIRNDPYVRHGLIPAYRVRRWNVVVGGEEVPRPDAG